MKPMESPHKGKTGIRRLLNTFGYSCAGLKEAFRNEDAFRQEVLLAGVLVEGEPLPGIVETFYAVTMARRFPNPLVRLLLTSH